MIKLEIRDNLELLITQQNGCVGGWVVREIGE